MFNSREKNYLNYVPNCFSNANGMEKSKRLLSIHQYLAHSREHQSLGNYDLPDDRISVHSTYLKDSDPSVKCRFCFFRRVMSVLFFVPFALVLVNETRSRYKGWKKKADLYVFRSFGRRPRLARKSALNPVRYTCYCAHPVYVVYDNDVITCTWAVSG